jgi:hypothetical protein
LRAYRLAITAICCTYCHVVRLPTGKGMNRQIRQPVHRWSSADVP